MKSVSKKQNKEVNSKCVDRVVVASHMEKSAVAGVVAVVVGIITITTIGIMSQEWAWGWIWSPRCR
jgi:hypothetical protein